MKSHPSLVTRATALNRSRRLRQIRHHLDPSPSASCHEEPPCYLPLPGAPHRRNADPGKRSAHPFLSPPHRYLFTNSTKAVTTQVLDGLERFAQWAFAAYCNSKRPVGQPVLCNPGECDLISTSNTVITATFEYSPSDSNDVSLVE